MNLKLAWRNLWRNRRRTFITIASVLFAIFLAILGASMQQGTWDHMINSVLGNYVGVTQVHKQGYWDDPIIDNSMEEINVDSILAENNYIENLAPRLESFALASAGVNTSGAMVTGVDPQRENALTELQSKLIEGTYFSDDDQAVIISQGLARKLKLSAGDTLVLLGQGYHGNSAVGKYPIKGVVKYGTPELNDRMVYLPMKEAQWFYAAPGMVTAYIVDPAGNTSIEKAKNSLKEQLGENYEVMDWKELMPELVQAVQADTGGMVIMFIVIYLVIGFGIFSTVVMMIAERQHEFGVLLAIGMKRWRMIVMVVMEMLLLIAIGIIVGFIVTLPIVLYFYNHPIELTGNFAEMYENYGFEPMFVFSIKPYIFLNQALIIFVITIIVTLYPVWNLSRMNSINAMRS